MSYHDKDSLVHESFIDLAETDEEEEADSFFIHCLNNYNIDIERYQPSALKRSSPDYVVAVSSSRRT